MVNEIQWGSIADWRSALGTIAASITALYLARSSTRVQLRVTWSLRVTVGDGEVGPELVALHATNTGIRPATVTHTTFRWGYPTRRDGLVVRWESAVPSPLPSTLGEGDMGLWAAEVGETNKWFAEQLFKEAVPTWLDEKALLKRLHETRRQKARTAYSALA